MATQQKKRIRPWQRSAWRKRQKRSRPWRRHANHRNEWVASPPKLRSGQAAEVAAAGPRSPGQGVRAALFASWALAALVIISVMRVGPPRHVRPQTSKTGPQIRVSAAQQPGGPSAFASPPPNLEAPVASLVGLVIGVAGVPQGNATVILVGSGVWPARSVRTDRDGRFAFGSIPDGVYELRAVHLGCVTPPVFGVRVRAHHTPDLVLRLQRALAIRGRVVRASDETPLPHAKVLVSSPSLGTLPQASESNDRGAFHISGLMPGRQLLTVQAQGYIAQHLEVSAGDAVVVTLRQAARLSGTVVDDRGQPVMDARVLIQGVLESGALLLPGQTGSAFQEDLFRLQRARGRLDGWPGSEAIGSLGVTSLPVPALDAAEGLQVTDHDGAFLLEDVPPGTVQLIARHPDHAPGLTDNILAVAGSERTGLQIMLPRASALVARVVDHEERPVRNVRVELKTEHDVFPRQVLTDDAGMVSFTGVAGPFVLTALPLGSPPARLEGTATNEDQLNVTLRISRSEEQLQVRLFDAEAFGAAGVAVRLQSLVPSIPDVRQQISDEEGVVVFEGLGPPPWLLEATHPDFVPFRETIEEVSEKTLERTLHRGFTLRGEVRDDWSDASVSGATVTFQPAGEGLSPGFTGKGPQRTTTDENGRFSLSQLPSSTGIVRLESDYHQPQEVQLEINDHVGRSTRNLGIVRLGPAGRLQGTVVDALSDPVPGARVRCGEHEVRTDPQGRFTLSGIAPGNHDLEAVHPAAGRLVEQNLRVRPTETVGGLWLRLPNRFDADNVNPTRTRLFSSVAVTLEALEGAVFIHSVAPHSAAEQDGLRPGDRLMAVGSNEVLELEQAHQLLRGPVDVETLIEIDRDGQRHYILTRRQFFEN